MGFSIGSIAGVDGAGKSKKRVKAVKKPQRTASLRSTQKEAKPVVVATRSRRPFASKGGRFRITPKTPRLPR